MVFIDVHSISIAGDKGFFDFRGIQISNILKVSGDLYTDIPTDVLGEANLILGCSLGFHIGIPHG